MIRVGIIGCGRMADQHLRQIRRIRGAQVVAACDAELLMAGQLAERFSIPYCFDSVSAMLTAGGLDVVHVTTSPASHFALARQCLESGVHVYIEKPFTLIASEAIELVRLAESRSLKLTAGHNAQFTPAMLRMRELIDAGRIGGRPVHLESHYCYSLGDAAYATAVLSDREHWVRQLPGSLLQNIISHGISKIAEFVTGDAPRVTARGFTSTFLRDIGQSDIIDEVRVIIEDEAQMTAYFTFSSQIAPPPHRLQVFGRRGSILVDEDHQVVVIEDDKEYKSYLAYFVPPLRQARQYSAAFFRNAGAFIRRDFHLPNDAGLKTLIDRFYRCIEGQGALPLSYREIIVTARIMDDIFAQVRGGHESA